MIVKLNNRVKITFLCLLVIMISGCISFVKKPEKLTARNDKTSKKIPTHHLVEAGETLYSIAFGYGRDVRDVARWNRIKRPYTIYPKQKLRVIPIKSDRKTKKQKTQKASQLKIVNNRIQVKQKPRSGTKLKWAWPTKGRVSSTFSYRDPGRRGIEILGIKGQPVLASAAGRIVYSGNGLRGYGNLIIVKHNETFFSAYAHTQGVVVKENEKVKLGQKLADMSNTGSDKTKLHFEIRRNGKPVNPLRYLPKRH